jgi:alpha 1,2-mannosyltransferase
MVHLQDNPFNSDTVSSPNKPSSYKRRRLWKITIRSSLVCILITVCYFFGRSIQWEILSENYGFNAKDVDFMRYFCSQIQPTSKQSIASANSLVQVVEEESEHHKAGYLNPQDTSLPDNTIPDQVWNDLPVKGAYYMVVRNENLADTRSVIRSMEDHMTNGTRYPWVFLNNQAFTADFKRYVKKVTNAPVFFGKIDLEVWEYPHWIDIPRAEFLMLQQEIHGAYKGASLSYHQLLRYHAGYFFHHPLLRNVEYTWRVEPGADYSCQMDQDMFLYMKQQQKKLGFVLTMRESPATVPTLWSRVNEFIDYYPEYILPQNETIWPWIYDQETNKYNMCHFWSNFQLADLSFFRSEAYQQYFKYLDNTGNFFYER